MTALATDHDATTRFVSRCGRCKTLLNEQRIPWHVHRTPVLVSHGLCPPCAEELERLWDEWVSDQDAEGA